MNHPSARRLATLAGALVTLLALAACDTSLDPPPSPLGANAVPDFGLTDVNPSSATYSTSVSPRDYLGRVSAWYFGHAT